MPRKPKSVRPLPTIWRVSDELWAMLAPTLDLLDPPKPTGRKRVEPRAALDAIIFRLRSGCQWNQLPKEFPDDSSVHRTFQRWERLGVLERIWATLVAECEELAVSTGSGRPPTGCWARPVWGDMIGPNPTGRGKHGTKKSLLVEKDGGSLAVVVAGANVHDAKLLAATIKAIVVERPVPSDERPQHLCLDKGYDNPTGRQATADHRPRLRPAYPADWGGAVGRRARATLPGPSLGGRADAGLVEDSTLAS